MPRNFFDTSALVKHFHIEVGTPKVEALLSEPSSRHHVSKLGAVELLSAFALRVRTGAITLPDFETLRKRLFTELTTRELEAARMTGFHYDLALRLIRKHGPTQRLRTLDAVQLAVALDLRGKGVIDQFICADQTLLDVAAAEGLTVIDAGQP